MEFNKVRSYLPNLGKCLLFFIIIFLFLYKDAGHSIGHFIHELIHTC